MCRNIHFRLVNRVKSSNNAKEQNEDLGGIHFPFFMCFLAAVPLTSNSTRCHRTQATTVLSI